MSGVTIRTTVEFHSVWQGRKELVVGNARKPESPPREFVGQWDMQAFGEIDGCQRVPDAQPSAEISGLWRVLPASEKSKYANSAIPETMNRLDGLGLVIDEYSRFDTLVQNPCNA